MLLVVYSRNPVALRSNQFEINKIWQSTQSKKAQTLEKKGLLCPQRALWFPLSSCQLTSCLALLSLMWETFHGYRNINACVCACACLLAPHTCSFASVLHLCVFLLFYFNALSVPVRWTSCLNCIRAPAQAGHITQMKGAGGFFMYTAHLNCMSLLLCCDLALEG